MERSFTDGILVEKEMFHVKHFSFTGKKDRQKEGFAQKKSGFHEIPFSHWKKSAIIIDTV